VCLIQQKGIWKPRQCPELPLSIMTTPPRLGEDPPYDDRVGEDGLLHYRYRGRGGRDHPDNAGLRRAWELQIPIIYFRGVVRGWYLPFWPVLIAADDPGTSTFRVDLKAGAAWGADGMHIGDERLGPERGYSTGIVKRRTHQKEFHRMVLTAYRSRCGVCLLRHDRLLDAGHILPDGHPRGEPIVPNGIALCKLHHAAYDADILGVTPDLELEIRPDILAEKDGPMLVHGLQGFQGGHLNVPRDGRLRPNRDFLAERYEHFRRTG
jgi:putative restriction endonuclease